MANFTSNLISRRLLATWNRIYILVVLQKFRHWRKGCWLIEQCTSTITNLLLNGSVCDKITPSQELIWEISDFTLHHWDWGAKVLLWILLKEDHKKNVNGIRWLTRTTPTWTNLRFANDLKLFCNTRWNKVENLANCMRKYWMAKNVCSVANGIANFMGCKSISLGTPIFLKGKL